jgi:hypothetical protein
MMLSRVIAAQVRLSALPVGVRQGSGWLNGIIERCAVSLRSLLSSSCLRDRLRFLPA